LGKKGTCEGEDGEEDAEHEECHKELIVWRSGNLQVVFITKTTQKPVVKLNF